MKRWLAMVLAAVPVCALAQQGSVSRDNLPPAAPPGQAEKPDDDPTEMVPNPLDDLGAGQPAGKQVQQQGQPRRADWVRMGTATLQTLDKVNARGDTLVLKVGDSGHFGSLVITVRGCYVRASDQPADATAFLVIRDERPDAPGFSGWMVRSAPYMSMLAHPIYDVRVAGCSP